MKVNNIRLLPVLLISLSLLYNSCTLVGLGVGAIVDSSRPGGEVVKPNDYKTIEDFKKITVFLKDNSSKVGRFYEITEKHLILGTLGKIERVNLDEILSVEIKSKKNGKRYGLAIGLAIGLALDTVLFLRLLSPGGPIGGTSN